MFYQGDTIHATIWKNLIDNYKPKINEGSVYEMSNFKVQEGGRYRPVKNTLKIVFIYTTNVKEVEVFSNKFPDDYYFELASPDTLLARKNVDTQCSGNYPIDSLLSSLFIKICSFNMLLSLYCRCYRTID